MLNEKEAAFFELLITKEASEALSEEGYDEFSELESEPAIEPGYEIKHRHTFYNGLDE